MVVVSTDVINGFVAAPLLVPILLVANNRNIVGAYTIGHLSNVVKILTTAFMGIAAVVTVASLFGH